MPPESRPGKGAGQSADTQTDPSTCAGAAAARAEDAVIAHEVLGSPGAYSDRPDDALVAFVRICAHYFAHDAWLEDGRLLRDAHRLAGIPGVLIHGRLDIGSPLKTAWELAKAWPEAELQVIDDAGHTGSPAMHRAVLTAIARFGEGR